MNRFWSSITQKIEPYVPGEQPRDMQYIKLNTNENPYSPSPRAMEAMHAAINAELRRYPAPGADDFRQAVAQVRGVDPACVFAGNGSDEVLAMAFMAFFDPGAPLLYPDLSYSFYPVYAKLFGLESARIAVDGDLRIRPEDYARPCGGIVFPNPNAPTSCALGTAQIEDILRAHPDVVVLVDEAYAAFGARSVVPLIGAYDNLVVVTTLSKSHGLAGLRAAYAIAQPHLIEALERIKNSFNSYTMDRIAIAGATAAMLDVAYTQETCQKVMRTRAAFSQRLRDLGFTMPDSRANFVLATHGEAPASRLFADLRARGVLVRYFDAPRLDNALRISIGTDGEMARVADILAQLV
nr:histidinol-phosphate transaminase [Maliibacterium massiliense]